ncbi:tetratricopeptide repeat protein [Serratia entomophila]|jgi:tetratricopeptide (TPR) repeat protein|uniref:Tetratricopeptide repeat protein n=1 Tax=Serratia entomophila TaxID=42906 RepID=A0ABY5CPG9_9GAMM|nr:tetratricopeptide repeat protein [Serratia entomophila]USU99792.1 tetratricopeptide repeat protein [Serratia entomophila]CAI1074221.1 lipoprotein NlpI [Serratia entomophila]CAI1077582.1 lipoprotein NlpI [Serratia entomophila]CAI1098515.1 lipoprotein NlpI [Serratia entomophila]CAI1159756.1 lipoprotein NlpI [Serratia entomophila]
MSATLTIEQLKRLGRYPEATELARQQLLLQPEDAGLHYQLACLYDVQGLEQQAIPCYLAALARDLPAAQRQGAWLGLGSTYRALGQYQQSLSAFDSGLTEFPQAKELTLFRAMTLYNLGETKQAVADLLLLLAETSSHGDISSYQRAIREYAADLDRIG